MVYTVHYPSELTEEELRLKEAFEKLRRMKKLVQAVKSRKVEDGGSAGSSRATFKRSLSGVDAKGATEQAKKLVKSGGVTIQKVEEKQCFKRSKQQQKRKEDSESERKEKCSIFGPAHTSFEGSPIDRRCDNRFDETGGGKTIYIRSFDLREDTLRRTFSPFGNILSLQIDDRRRSANLTYESHREADRAITEMNGNMVNGITLQVSMARRGGPPAFAGPRPSFRPSTPQRFNAVPSPRFEAPGSSAGTSGPPLPPRPNGPPAPPNSNLPQPQNSSGASSGRGGSAWADMVANRGSSTQAQNFVPKKDARDLVKYSEDD